MNTIKLFLTIFLCLFFLIGNSQNQAVLKAYYDDADYDLSQEDYSNALVKLRKIYFVDSTNANVNYLIGMCYLNSVDEKNKAYIYLKKAAAKVSLNYQSETFDEKGAPPDVYNKLGDALALDYKFDQAIEMYSIFEKTIKKNDHELKETTERKIRSCEFAKVLTKNPVIIDKKNLNIINSIMSDFNPVLTPDQKQMFFTAQHGSRKSDDEKLIFKSTNQNGKWSSPVNYTMKLSQESNKITSFISRDGRSLLLIDDEESSNSIYETRIQQNIWSVPKKLSKKINAGTQQLDAFLTKDGKTLYFSSNKKGGFGGTDIYKSVKKDGEWSESVNLGPIINTPFDDINPKILEDNSVLFFSSKGHSSMGGFDVLYSKVQPDGSWSEPENIGYPLNTPDDETDYWPINNGFSGYMSIYTPKGEGEKDIFFVSVTPAIQNLGSHNLSSKFSAKDTGNLIITAGLNTNPDTSTSIANSTNQLHNLHANDNTNINTNDTTSLMTILIKITRNPLESAYLKEIEGVRAFRGQDSVIRYYYGQYKNYEEANKDFEKILKIGFYSAQLKNIKEDTLYNYSSANFTYGQDSADIVTNYSDKELNTDNTDNKLNPENKTNDQNKTNNKNNLSENKEKQKKEQEKKDLAAKKEQEKKDLAMKKEEEKKEKQRKKEEAKQKEKEDREKRDNAKTKENSNTIETTDNNIKSDLKNQLLNDITDKLINATGDIYIIQISTVPQAGNLEYFKNIPYTTEHDCKDGKYRYTTGVFENIEDAKKYLEEIKTKGYADAYLVNFNKVRSKFYNEDIAAHIKTYNLNYETGQTTAEVKEEEKLYSVQIASSIKPVEDGYFKGITDVKEKLTKNGFYKYYYGKFIGYKNAKTELENARTLGYIDAFIIKYTDGETIASQVKDLKEEKETTEENNQDFQNAYTIQVASAKKQSDLKYFKGLEVKEIIGNNGFYIYIYGDYKSVADARKDIAKVKNLGFKDAFINRAEKYQ